MLATMGGCKFLRILMKHLSALAFLTLAACANAGGLGTSDFATVGNIRVNQVSADVFEVMSRPGGNPMAQYWCGAGNYAGQVLGAPAGAVSLYTSPSPRD